MGMVEGRIVTNGVDLISYLDGKLDELRKKNLTVTGIVIGTATRKELSKACQRAMGQFPKEEETLVKFRGALLIEDGINQSRLEVVAGSSPVLPVDNIFGGMRR